MEKMMEKKKDVISALQKMTKRRFIAVCGSDIVKTIGVLCYDWIHKEYYKIIFLYIFITFLNIF